MLGSIIIVINIVTIIIVIIVIVMIATIIMISNIVTIRMTSLVRPPGNLQCKEGVGEPAKSLNVHCLLSSLVIIILIWVIGLMKFNMTMMWEIWQKA